LYCPTPQGLFVELGQRTAVISFGLPWQGFLNYPKLREATRIVARRFAQYFGSPQVMYLPEVSGRPLLKQPKKPIMVRT